MTPFSGGLWRAKVGTEWHQRMQAQAEEAHGADATFEITISATWIERDWRMELQGRIDQLIQHDGQTTLREVKSLSRPLPMPEKELTEDYPHYLRQLAAYLVCWKLTHPHETNPPNGELLFVDINEGITQTLQLSMADAETLVAQQAARIRPFMEHFAARRSALRDTDFPQPFDQWRDGQADTHTALHQHAATAPIILFEAPTGFGKTGLALHYAINRLRDSAFDRIVYLTSKSTGQKQVIDQLGTMLPHPTPLQFLQVRNREEHRITSALLPEDGLTRDQLIERWQSSGLSPMLLFHEGTITLDATRHAGETHGIPPYEIMRACLPHADVWIADFNYLFHPGSSGIFYNQPGFDPARTLLIIDEAHNLPSRTADALGWSLEADSAEWLTGTLRANKAPAALIRAWEDLSFLLDGLKQSDALPLTAHYELADHLAAIRKSLDRERIPWEELDETTLNQLFTAASAHRLLSEDIPHLLWSPRNRTATLSCLDASTLIAQTIRQFGQTLLMSATLSPTQLFLDECGLTESDITTVPAHAPWREHAYDVAIDLRPDTRFKHREQHYALTAHTVEQLTIGADSPVAVFFSSYRYAEAIRTYLETQSPLTRILIQPRGLTLAEQWDFIDEALLSAHALFLILGSGFSEGIDRLGGRISRAMVVGPALPEVNAIQKAREQAFKNAGHRDTFERTYQFPGMRKINQAVGRLVRAPGQHAKVLLHCRRFSESSYLRLLDPACQPDTRITADTDLHHWLDQ